MSIETLAAPLQQTRPEYMASFTVDGQWRGRCRSDIRARHFAIAVSEPEELGGDDSAANPMELILAGLQGCLAVVIETIAKEHKADLRHVQMSTEGSLDVRGFLGQARVQPYFQEVSTRIEIDIDLAPEDFEPFIAAVEKRCPAGTMISAANVYFTIDWVRIGS